MTSPQYLSDDLWRKSIAPIDWRDVRCKLCDSPPVEFDLGNGDRRRVCITCILRRETP